MVASAGLANNNWFCVLASLNMSSPKKEYHYKLLFIGDASVGKSSILYVLATSHLTQRLRYMDGIFSDTIDVTVGSHSRRAQAHN